VRQAAATSISRFGPKARLAIPALIGALKDEDEMARYYTACAIASIGPASIPALIEALNEDAPHVREEAIRVLNWLGPEAVYNLMASADRETTEKKALEWLSILPGTWDTGEGGTLQIAAATHHSFSWFNRPPADWWCTWDKRARCLIVGTCESIQLAAVFSKFYRLHILSDDMAEGVLVKEHCNQYGAVVHEEHVARVTVQRMNDDRLVIRWRGEESTLTRAGNNECDTRDTTAGSKGSREITSFDKNPK
jgi:hypothetical protein